MEAMMVQKVETFLGIHLAVDTFIDEQEYVVIRERLADRVTNICERTIYMATGEMRELDRTDDELVHFENKYKE